MVLQNHHLRKIFNILLVMLYLIPAIGFSVDLHKCGKKIKIVSVNASHKSKCPCGTNMPFNCCKDVHLSIKIDKEQKCSKSIIIPHSNDIKQFLTLPVFTLGELSSQIEVFDFSSYHAPPFKNWQPVYLTNCTFRI